MMCDALRRLKFASVESYQYVGLGSVYFTDFSLFHKALGVLKMISIEREVKDRPRFEFNLPFANVEMRWGSTSVELPGVDLRLRTIAWLDYDGPLDVAMLNDMQDFAMRVVTGSVLIVSVQCNPPVFDATDPTKHVTNLAKAFGKERIDPTITDADLPGFGLAKVFREVIINEIAVAIADRNGVLPPSQHMEFEQIFNFQYADGAHMLTVGGVFFDKGQRGLFTSCMFGDLNFVRPGPDAFRIGIPKLTLRELRMLEEQMPLAPGRRVAPGPMPRRDASQFVKIYRYFPNFATVDL